MHLRLLRELTPQTPQIMSNKGRAEVQRREEDEDGRRQTEASPSPGMLLLASIRQPRLAPLLELCPPSTRTSSPPARTDLVCKKRMVTPAGPGVCVPTRCYLAGIRCHGSYKPDICSHGGPSGAPVSCWSNFHRKTRTLVAVYFPLYRKKKKPKT